MRFNIPVGLICRFLALNRGASISAANSDMIVGGVVKPSLLAIILVSVLAKNQAAQPAATAPTITNVDPIPPVSDDDFTITGTNFGTDSGAITVTFSWAGIGTSGVLNIGLPAGTAVTPTTIEMTAPEGLPSGVTIDVVVTVNGVSSNTFAIQPAS